MTAAAPGALRVAYCADPVPALLERPGTLAVFTFDGQSAPPGSDPRRLGVLLAPLAGRAPCERWSVEADVSHGRDGDVRWACGGGWRFVAIEADEDAQGGLEAATRYVYDRLLGHAAGHPERHCLRIWNYLDAINAGAGDSERYRRFCSARARSMAVHGLERYPAATAIGHHGVHGRLQVYALCAAEAGVALENPRQVSAWNYPRRYGPDAPNFVRAMQLPRGGLAISGTAAVLGADSHHLHDVTAQATEAIANLRALLAGARLPAFAAASPLKVYVRHLADAARVSAVLERELAPSVPRLLLQGDVCRRELLVEIDGWRLAEGS
ncbi:MAG: pteridine-dependent deoxygenase [Rhodanobacteraceae bacterium]|nr:MAG: pteridine-dependent deoxygenase [Rhodanobacteraceae bacterium]